MVAKRCTSRHLIYLACGVLGFCIVVLVADFSSGWSRLVVFLVLSLLFFLLARGAGGRYTLAASWSS